MRTRREVQAIIFDRKNKEKVLLIRKIDFVDRIPYWRLVKGGIKKNETDKDVGSAGQIDRIVQKLENFLQ